MILPTILTGNAVVAIAWSGEVRLPRGRGEPGAARRPPRAGHAHRRRCPRPDPKQAPSSARERAATPPPTRSFPTPRRWRTGRGRTSVAARTPDAGPREGRTGRLVPGSAVR